MTAKITLLPGDGIGNEIIEGAVKVTKAVAEKFDMTLQFEERLIGGCSYDKYGKPLTEDTLQTCYDSDAVLLGAVGGYKWEAFRTI